MWLLLCLLLLEGALLFFRIRIKAIQPKMTLILRAASILLLVALCGLSAITWGFRYYLLAAVLTISAGVSAVSLLWKKEKAARVRRTVCRSVGMGALLSIALLPALLFPEYRPLPTTGPYQVATAVRHFTDESRSEVYGQGDSRRLAAAFWYPADTAGSFPLVVFSHGAFGTRTSNETLFRELASHGYLVCSIDHTYQCLVTTDADGKMGWISGTYMSEIRRENAREDKQNSLALYQKWMDVRVGDIHFVIDTMKADAADDLYRLVDNKHIGVMGHSLGGAAALGVGRTRKDIGAVISLEAPFLCDILDVEKDEFVFESAPYPVPVLNVYSDSAWPNLAQWPQYGQNVRLLSGSEKDVYNLHIAGVGHLSLTDLSLASPILTRLLNGHPSSVSPQEGLQRINQACLAFFDCFLKGTGTFGS